MHLLTTEVPLPSPLLMPTIFRQQLAMPTNVYVDVVFGRGSDHPVMYRLMSDDAYEPEHVGDVILEISDQQPSRRLGGDYWIDDQTVGDVNRGRLYRATLKCYPVPGHDVPDPVDVAVKWVRGRHAIASLRKEAIMYNGPLADLQGEVVPICGGFFTGTVKEGYHIGCLILEWCPQNEHTTFGKPTEEEL